MTIAMTIPPLASLAENLPFEVGAGFGTAARFGLIVLETDQTVEAEFRELLPQEGIALHCTRMHNEASITPETLAQLRDGLTETTALLPPGVTLDAIGFACTSGTIMIGEDTVAELIRAGRPSRAVTEPVTAALAAFQALDVKRIALLTPYARSVNTALRDALWQRGIEVVAMGSFSEPDDTVVVRIEAKSVEAAAINIGSHPDAEAVFISCTSLRAASIIANAERALGKPVTSSNHALAWHMLRASGIDRALPERGRLFGLKLDGSAASDPCREAHAIW